MNVSKATQFLNAWSNVLGGWFLFVLIVICALTIFMCICNAIVYIQIAVNNDNPDISKGLAITLAILNISLVLIAIFVFFYVLLKWSQLREIKNGFVEFTTQNVVSATFDKVNPAVEQRKYLPANIFPAETKDILKQDKGYTSQELENLTYQLRPEFLSSNPESLQSFMNKYD